MRAWLRNLFAPKPTSTALRSSSARLGLEAMEDRVVLSPGTTMIRSPGLFSPVAVSSPPVSPAPAPVSQPVPQTTAVARNPGLFNLDPTPQPVPKSVTQIPKTPIYAIEQLFQQKYQELGGEGRGVNDKWVFRRIGASNPLGQSLSGIQPTRDGTGYFQEFQKGSLYWSEATGVHAIYGRVRDKWLAMGGHSKLGYPSTDTLATADLVGQYNHFLKSEKDRKSEASIYWSPNTDGAVAIQGEIRKKYAQMGFDRGPLGLPRFDEGSTPGGLGRAVVFQNGVVTWSATTGAFALTGSIADKWMGTLNWGRGWWSSNPATPDDRVAAIGLPVSDVSESADWGIDGGQVAEFENGAIFASARGTFFLEGAVYNRFREDPGFFGFPITDQAQGTRAGVGQMASFENGSVIAWNGSSLFRAVELHGPVLEKWRKLDHGNGPLGFPIRDTINGLPNYEPGEQGEFEYGEVWWHQAGLIETEVIYEQGENLVYSWQARERHDKWIVRWYADTRLGNEEDRGGAMSQTLTVPARRGVWYDFHVKAGDETGNPFFYPYDYTPWTQKFGHSLGRAVSGPPELPPEPPPGSADAQVADLVFKSGKLDGDPEFVYSGESFTIIWEESNAGSLDAGNYITSLQITDKESGTVVFEQGVLVEGLKAEESRENQVEVPGLAAGKYWVRIVVNAYGTVRERDGVNNGWVVNGEYPVLTVTEKTG